MNIKKSFLFFLTPFLCLSFSLFGNVGAIAGTNIFTIAAGSENNATWKIVSASTLGEPVYTGTVSSYDNSNGRILFDVTTDDNDTTIYPFSGNGVFNPDIQIPEFVVTVSSEVITGIAPHYGDDGYSSSGTGFSNTPQIIVSSGSGSQCTATATISSGEITGITVTDGGSGYDSTAEVTVVGGPHFVRITQPDSAYYGRVFLITDNNQSRLDLDFSVAAQDDVSSQYFTAGDSIEVVAAATLGRIFGTRASSLPANFGTASSLGYSSSSDWVYVWDYALGGYLPHQFVSAAGSSGFVKDGWYTVGNRRPKNNLIIYPDEAFIIAKRSSGTISIEIEGAISMEDQKLYLPVTGDQMVANNPYGMDLMLAELIPSTSISSSSSVYNKFRPGSSDSETNMDSVTILTGGQWKKYWYNTSSSNHLVTEMMVAGARDPNSSGRALTGDDLFIGSGTITAVETCTSANGSGATTNGTDGNFTKITAGGITRDLTGFTINLSDIQGYMLNAEGTHEVNATTGENVDTNGTGSVVYSNISGSYEVVGGASGYVVIEKQRDINFKSDEGSPAWTIGDAGTGYTTTAKWWAIGGGGSGASGTVNSSGTSFTVTAGGSGYSSAPQIVISGGGWTDDLGASGKGNQTISASDGIIIYRGATSGVKAFINPANPTAN